MDQQPTDSTAATETLLTDLAQLHQLLLEPGSEHGIPVLNNIVDPSLHPDTLARLRPLLQDTAQTLLQDVIRDFSPQITEELEKRLRLHLEQLINQSAESNQPFQFAAE